MKGRHADIGCSAWLIGMFLAVFATEWLLLEAVFGSLPREKWLTAIVVVIVLIIVGDWIAVCMRVRRKNK